MMKTRRVLHRSLFALALSLGAGCASTSPTYYTLDMTPSGAPAPAYHLVPGLVTTGEALATRRILIKKQPTVVEYYATSEWAAGLEEIVAHKLSAEWGGPDGRRQTLHVDVQVQAFEQIDTPAGADVFALLAVRVRPENASRYDTPLLEKNYECRRQSATPAPPDVVQALDDCMETIAAAIAADTAGLSVSGA